MKGGAALALKQLERLCSEVDDNQWRRKGSGVLPVTPSSQAYGCMPACALGWLILSCDLVLNTAANTICCICNASLSAHVMLKRKHSCLSLQSIMYVYLHVLGL
jgi:hypothetical protein